MILENLPWCEVDENIFNCSLGSLDIPLLKNNSNNIWSCLPTAVKFTWNLAKAVFTYVPTFIQPGKES